MTQITVNVNQQPKHCVSPISIAELLALKQLEKKGTAVARNNNIVSKSQWSATYLNHGDTLDIFTLVAGG